MALAQFMQLCLDATDRDLVRHFWSAAMGLRWQPDDRYPGGDVGGEGETGLRIESVPERKVVKNRVHPDIYASSIADLERLGAVIVTPPTADSRWTVMSDPAGNEFCAFLRDDLSGPRLHGVGIDCRDPKPLAVWWGEVLGGAVSHNPRGFSTVERTADRPFTLDFNAVPEPRTVKNRMHWDVRTSDIAGLLAKGASVLREPDDTAYWHVLADPEGNEFCAFPPKSKAVRPV